MSDLIDREETINRIDKWYGDEYCTPAIISIIKDMPSAGEPQYDCETCEHYNNIGDWCRTCGVSNWHPRMKGADDDSKRD